MNKETHFAMERLVIACYKPKVGQQEKLKELMKTHLTILREQDLATERESIVMEAEDGTVVEVFGWKSQEAIDTAHSDPVVLEMWQAYEEVCEYIPIGQLPEGQKLFQTFAPLN